MEDLKSKRPSRKGVKTPHPGLTECQSKFVENMAKDLPLKLAMVNTGFKEENSVILGLQLMKKPHIRKAIEDRKLQAAKFAKITPEQVLGATAMRAFCSIDDAFDEEGRFSMTLARETGAVHLIKKLKQRQGYTEVEFYDNAQAQEKLANYLGMDIAPKDTNDTVSLKQGIEEVAKQIAKQDNRKIPTHEDRKQAWSQIFEWTKDSRAKYSNEAIQEVGKEFSQ